MHNPNCDGSACRKSDGEVRKLPLGGGANLILCHDCYLHELAYRRAKNLQLAEDNRFDLPAWCDLEVVNG